MSGTVEKAEWVEAILLFESCSIWHDFRILKISLYNVILFSVIWHSYSGRGSVFSWAAEDVWITFHWNVV